MDALERSDLELARSQSPGEKLRQALEMMSAGIRLKRAALRERHPSATDEEIAAMLTAWLVSDG